MWPFAQATIGQMTPTQQRIVGGVRRAAGTRKRKRKAKAAAPRKRRSKAKAARPAKRGRARLVKGSAAAKRYMASIRRKRRK